MAALDQQDEQDALMTDFLETVRYDVDAPWTEHLAETEVSEDEPDTENS